MAARPKISERKLQITKTKQLFLFSVTLKACWFQRSHPRDPTFVDRLMTFHRGAKRKNVYFFSGEIIRAVKEKVEAKKFVAQSIRLWRSLIHSIENSPDERFTARISSHFLRHRLTRHFPRASSSHLDLCDFRLVDCIANRADFRRIDCSVIYQLMTPRIWKSRNFDSWWEMLKGYCVTTKRSLFILFSFKWVDEHETADEGIVADPTGSDKLLSSVSADPTPAADPVIHLESFGSWGRQDQRNCDAFRVGSAAELCVVVDQHVVSGAGRSVCPELTVATEDVGKSGKIIITQA